MVPDSIAAVGGTAVIVEVLKTLNTVVGIFGLPFLGWIMYRNAKKAAKDKADKDARDIAEAAAIKKKLEENTAVTEAAAKAATAAVEAQKDAQKATTEELGKIHTSVNSNYSEVKTMNAVLMAQKMKDQETIAAVTATLEANRKQMADMQIQLLTLTEKKTLPAATVTNGANGAPGPAGPAGPAGPPGPPGPTPAELALSVGVAGPVEVKVVDEVPVRVEISEQDMAAAAKVAAEEVKT